MSIPSLPIANVTEPTVSNAAPAPRSSVTDSPFAALLSDAKAESTGKGTATGQQTSDAKTSAENPQDTKDSKTPDAIATLVAPPVTPPVPLVQPLPVAATPAPANSSPTSTGAAANAAFAATMAMADDTSNVATSPVPTGVVTAQANATSVLPPSTPIPETLATDGQAVVNNNTPQTAGTPAPKSTDKKSAPVAKTDQDAATGDTASAAPATLSPDSSNAANTIVPAPATAPETQQSAIKIADALPLTGDVQGAALPMPMTGPVPSDAPKTESGQKTSKTEAKSPEQVSTNGSSTPASPATKELNAATAPSAKLEGDSTPVSVSASADKPAAKSQAPTHAVSEPTAPASAATTSAPQTAAQPNGTVSAIATPAPQPTATPSAPHMPVRVSAEGLTTADADALAVRIAHQASAGNNHFDIRLDPPELGRIDIRLHIDAQGQTQAQLSADKPQTLELLQRDAGTLERALKNSGLDLGNGLSFSLKGDGRQTGARDSENGRGRYGRSDDIEATGNAQISQAGAWRAYSLGAARVDITI